MMTERGAAPAADEENASADASAGSSKSAETVAREMRTVVGRRGYDEAEDETTTEDEEH